MNKNCQYCGASFTVNSNVQKFCSPSCMRKSNYRKDIDHSRALHRKHYQLKGKERLREYSKKHPEIRRRSVRNYQRKHPDRVKFLRQRWYWRNRIKIVESLGGHCSICGYSKNIAALELHHKDPRRKDTVRDTHLATIKPEDYVLLCSNCHKEIENPNLSIEAVREIARKRLEPWMNQSRLDTIGVTSLG